jgi:hypothetical protein
MADLLERVPEDQRDGFRRHLEAMRKLREHYGYTDGSYEPLTMLEMKAGEIRNAEAITWEVIDRWAGTRANGDYFAAWHGGNGTPRVTSKRDLPEFAFHTVHAECWTPEETRRLVANAWTEPEWPGQLGLAPWRQMFAAAGFLCDDEECDLHPGGRPHDGPITAYRGAFRAYNRGLSWTTDRGRAEWFAGRGDMAGGRKRTMRLWTVDVPAGRVLAHFGCRGESEIVADVRGLQVREA